MLYNILPPLIFFASFAGIIILVSRIAMRARRQQFSHNVQQEAHSTSSGIIPENLLNPARAGIELIKNPLGILVSNVKQSAGGIKTFWQGRRDRKQAREAIVTAVKEEEVQEVTAPTDTTGISIPTSGWRDRAMKLVKKGTGSISGAIATVRRRGNTHSEAAKTTVVPLQEVFSPSRSVKTSATSKTTPPPATTNTSPIRIIRVEKPIAATKEVIPNEQPKKEVASPEGRFTARFKKPEKPKTSLLEAAHDAIEAAQYEKAEEMLVPYIIEHTRDCDAYMLLGQIAIARSAWPEAMEIFQQIIQLKPKMADAQAGLGYAALQEGRFSIALQALQRAHEADPQNKKILYQLLNIARRLDNKILQKSVLEQLTELEPGNQEIAEALAQIYAQEKARA